MHKPVKFAYACCKHNTAEYTFVYACTQDQTMLYAVYVHEQTQKCILTNEGHVLKRRRKSMIYRVSLTFDRPLLLTQRPVLSSVLSTLPRHHYYYYCYCAFVKLLFAPPQPAHPHHNAFCKG